MAIVELSGSRVLFTNFDDSIVRGRSRVSVQRFTNRLVITPMALSVREEDRLSDDILIIDLHDGQTDDIRLADLIRKTSNNAKISFVQTVPGDPDMGALRYIQV